MENVPSVPEFHTYDPLNRLLTAQTQATSGGDCWGQSFGNNGPPPTLAADALANLFYTSSIRCSSPSPQYTMNPNNNNQFTGTGIGYDADGDMTADAAYTYTYDAENRIISASGMTNGPYCYTYNYIGQRVMKAHASGGSCSSTATVDMQYWRSISGDTIAETDGTGSTTNSNYNEYVFFAGRRIAQSNPSSGNVFYYFVDHLGSTRVVTTPTGTACYEADYLPYGNENTPSGFTNNCAVPIRYKFTGYERDAETAYGTSSGNDYAFARYYNTRLGRFMSADPLDGDVSYPQTLNHYTYTGNNPLNMVDPTGLFSIIPPVAGGACVPCDIGIGIFDILSLLFFSGPRQVTLTPPDWSANNPFESGPSITPGLANSAFGEEGGTIAAAGTICVFVPVCGEVEGTIFLGGAIILASGAIIEGVKDGIIKIPPIYQSRGNPPMDQANDAWREIQRICRSRGVELDRGHRRQWHDKYVTGRGLRGFRELVQAGVDAFCPAAN